MNPDLESVETWKTAFRNLHEYLVRNDFKGWEYDDMLASPLVNILTRWSLWARIVAVQTSKRLPINLRSLLCVPKLRSTKAFGFMVKGYLLLYRATKDEQYLKFARHGLEWLLDNRSSGYSGHCWGNDFDFASRAGFFPQGLPTVVWSAHIQEAFEMAWEILGDRKYREAVEGVGWFVFNDLEKTGDSSGHCIAYAPKMQLPVHNSNLLGAVALLRAWKQTKDEYLFEAADKAVRWSESRINSDGSWYYGDESMLHWIDNYHTAYNLDCLCKAREISNGRIGKFDLISKTYNFWKSNLFTQDGIPKFYHDRLYPIDIQATAQAIESFARYSQYDPCGLEWAAKITKWALLHMQKDNGAFRYRLYERWVNQLEPIHWGQGTMLSALGYLIYYATRSGGENE